MTSWTHTTQIENCTFEKYQEMVNILGKNKVASFVKGKNFRAEIQLIKKFDKGFNLNFQYKDGLWSLDNYETTKEIFETWLKEATSITIALVID